LSVNTDLAVVAADLGSTLADATAEPMGDARATWRMVLADGRVASARMLQGASARDQASRLLAVADAAALAGVPAPRPVRVHQVATKTWLSSPWILGESGAAWLNAEVRAIRLAESSGRLATVLHRVETAGLQLDATSGDSRSVASTIEGQLDSIGPLLSINASRAIRESARWLRSEPRWRPAFSHGDYAPINMVIGSDGELLALLDFERAQLDSPLADVAWWSWVVSHHHPDVWHASHRKLLESAEIDASQKTEDHMRAVVMARLLQLSVTSAEPEARYRWRERLEAASGR
jgi:aminoglycoside phosphotransferase (APT) family kinase protein